jgi:peroxiredoxin Q/BCP
MKLLVTLAVTVIVAVAGAAFAADEKAAPKVGDKAPDFKLKGSDGKEYTLKQFAGKQAVVIAWFPKAFTGG